MLNETDNVLVFPGWRKKLEKESLDDLKNRKFEQALSKLDILIEYDISDHEIVFGKLICLMELGRYDEAIFLCEELLKKESENYSHYVHIYLTILFQTSQYDLLMDYIDNELKDNLIPNLIKDQFTQLYDLSKQMNNDIIRKESKANYIELTDAINKKNHSKQRHLLESLRRTKLTPNATVIDYLDNGEIHPVIKTVIYMWLQDKNFSEEVVVEKLGSRLSTIPTKIIKIREHHIMQKILLAISDLEQENPSLYILIEQTVYRYLYVCYPILPKESEIQSISKALKIIGFTYLHIPIVEDVEKEVLHYVESITKSEQLYLSVIEE